MFYSIVLFQIVLISAVLNAAPTNTGSSSSVAGVNPAESPQPSTIMAYMLELRNNLTDANGKPKLSDVEDPTEVWALQDTGMCAISRLNIIKNDR